MIRQRQADDQSPSLLSRLGVLFQQQSLLVRAVIVIGCSAEQISAQDEKLKRKGEVPRPRCCSIHYFTSLAWFDLFSPCSPELSAVLIELVTVVLKYAALV